MRIQSRALLLAAMLSWAVVGYYWSSQPASAQTVSLQPTTPGTTEEGNINIDGTGLFWRKVGIGWRQEPNQPPGPPHAESMLHLQSSELLQPRILIEASNSSLYSGLYFRGIPSVFGGAFYRHNATNDLHFLTSDDVNNPKVVISNSGNLGIGTTAPGSTLDVAGDARFSAGAALGGDVKIEYGGSPRLVLYSRGNGTQQYSLRATNDDDDADGARLVVRNESYGSDVLTVTGGGGASSDRVGIGTTRPETKLDISGGDVKIEYAGSPRLILYSRGDGTQQYSLRATNNDDDADGARLVVRNESYGSDVLTVTGGGGASSNRVGIGTSSPRSKLHVVGKATITGGVDPPYISFSAESHESIREFAKSVEEHEKVMQFWNGAAHRLEVYVVAEDRFYTVTGEPVD